MLDFNFGIRWPFNTRFANLKTWYSTIPFAHKHCELQVCKTNDILCLNFCFTTHSEADHAGLRLGIGLLGYSVDLDFYDDRHKEVDLNNNTPTMWEVKFCNLDKKTGNYVTIRTEICLNVFEADQLVTDVGSDYDKCFLTQIKHGYKT